MQQLIGTSAGVGSRLESLRSAGLSEVQIRNLLWLKADVIAGRRSELTPEAKRLLFYRYMYRQGLLHD